MRLLLVEDNASDAELLAASLWGVVGTVELCQASSLPEAVDILRATRFDSVLLGFAEPGAAALGWIDRIRGVAGSTPIVVLTGREDEEFAISALKRGAQDCVVSCDTDGHTISRTIRHAIERQRSQARLADLTQCGPSTEIPNRIHFEDQLDRAMARARRQGRKLALVLLRLDQFGAVKNSVGPTAGDKLLQQLARRLRRAIRKGDFLGRLGTDEFAVLVEGINGPLEAESLASAMMEVVGRPFQLQDQQIEVGTSIGITIFPDDNSEPTVLLQHARTASRRAREFGRSAPAFFHGQMDADLRAYHRLEHDIKEALENQSFRLAYHPKVNLRDRRLQGLEALLRWECPTRGVVAPPGFLPVAEESGHIVPLGYWVFGEVCRSIQNWQHRELPLVPVSVNVSAKQFQQADFHARLTDLIDRHRVDPQMIELELTERLVMDDIDVAIRRLRQLKETGLRVSIDDFGTGHSCLRYLQRLPIDILKIDQSFVAQIGSAQHSGMVIEAVISLARSLRIDAVAEGVETPEQLEFLIDHGCHLAQGFLFGRPISEAEVVPLLEELRDDTGLHANLIMPVAGAAGD